MRPASARPIRYQSQRQVSQVFRVPVFWEEESGVPRIFVGSKLSPKEVQRSRGPEAQEQRVRMPTGGGSHTTARVRQVSSNEPVMTPGTATHQTSKQGIRAQGIQRESPQSKKGSSPLGTQCLQVSHTRKVVASYCSRRKNREVREIFGYYLMMYEMIVRGFAKCFSHGFQFTRQCFFYHQSSHCSLHNT